MKSLLTVFALLASCVWAQTASLKTALYALTSSEADRTLVTKQLADAMMPLARSNRQPSRHSVEAFAAELGRSVAGKELTIVQVRSLENVIAEMMRGSVPNYTSTGHLRDALSAIHIDSADERAITTRFLAIGEEVRGPDDLQLMRYK
jgi:hypothetical protein